MSRDFTPAELYVVDKALREDLGYSFRDGVYWQTVDGETLPLINREAYEVYPEMTFLFDDFGCYYRLYKDNKKILEVFDKMEVAIEKIEHCYETKEPFSAKSDYEEVLHKWFFGKLDKDYYYNLENNSRLGSFIRNKINNAVIKDFPEFV